MKMIELDNNLNMRLNLVSSVPAPTSYPASAHTHTHSHTLSLSLTHTKMGGRGSVEERGEQGFLILVIAQISVHVFLVIFGFQEPVSTSQSRRIDGTMSL